MNIETIFARIKGALHGAAGAHFSFGNAIKVGDISVIPVAKVSFAFGGGGGNSSSQKKKKKQAESKADNPEGQAPAENIGGGGGGRVKTDPIGIYTIKDDKARFYPIVTVREIVTTFGVVIILLYKIRRLRRKA